MLAGSGIEVPELSTYAQTLWEFWERTYSPDRRKDRALARERALYDALLQALLPHIGACQRIAAALAETVTPAGPPPITRNLPVVVFAGKSTS